MMTKCRQYIGLVITFDRARDLANLTTTEDECDI